MKLAIIGYSGSGKSTLARFLGKQFHIPVLHLDCIHWLPGWREREAEEEKRMAEQFLNQHDFWVIDGNYTNLSHERRMTEADQIIFMKFNRFSSLYRAWKRYLRYRGQARESMASGCEEKMDREFIRWILIGGRRRKYRLRYQKVLDTYPEKTVVIRTQRQLNQYMSQMKKAAGKEMNVTA